MEENELYFKDSFSQSEENVNLTINNLTATCISSSDNKFNLDSNGNLVVNSIQVTGTTSIVYDIDKVYPIGAIYMSTNETNPSTLFGGVWERIKDKFLLCAGDTYTNGTVGGNESHNHTTSDHTLTINEIPSHNHSGTTSSNGSHTHSAKGYWRFASGASTNAQGMAYTLQSDDPISTSTPILNSGNHTHTITTDLKGGGNSHNHGNTNYSSNMPPYLAVYVWKRVS